MNTRRRPLISAAVAGTTALGVLGLSACGGGGSGTTADGKLSVVASFYPMQFLVEEIGRENVEVSTLTGPGVEPHDLELKPKQVAELGEAGFVLYLKGVQPAVDEAIEQSGTDQALDAVSLTGMRAYGEEDHDDHGGHDHDHDHGDHDHDHGDHGNEDDYYSTVDPHVWLDPAKYAELAEGVGKAMGEADPDHADAYGKNADALAKKLRALDEAYEDGLKKTNTRTFVTTHAAFGYLADRYDLHEEAIALDPESEPTPARMKELTGVVKDEGVDTVFFETLASDRTAKALARDLELRTAVLDPVEGITENSPGKDYFAVMRANLAALQKALGAE